VLLTHLAARETTLNPPFSCLRLVLGPPPPAAPHHSPCVLAAVLVEVQQEGQRRDGKEHPEKHGQHVPCKPSTGTLEWGGSPAAPGRGRWGKAEAARTQRQQPGLSTLTCVKRRAGVSCKGDKDERMRQMLGQPCSPTMAACPPSSARGWQEPSSQARTPPSRLPSGQPLTYLLFVSRHHLQERQRSQEVARGAWEVSSLQGSPSPMSRWGELPAGSPAARSVSLREA